ncbi:Amidase chry2 [Fulvia fulva]|uniref:Amidase chry2 n=1 Tax=Passalora fulva TaxID=5499 RepID=A0A9Q8PKM0_PASFU|nr:Amidase chry2 [Fulvia fulva]KAK4610873.1 Amidase chry2 [Fulvia fulva]UJO24193.1 Amidase chry2 [Fulvia fulva]WPV36942.1 Amidase chry2 [Fulvia fulva]
MCGISSLVALPGSNNTLPHDETRRQVQASLDNISHRGPDSSGIWINTDGRIALGHNRLAINDLSESGCQPLHSPDGNVHAVVNGELYDFEDVKTKLTRKIGYHFSGRSDSEIVVALYQAYGMDFMQHLRGEFVLCLYDEKKKLFIAARDRYGIKPLFWTKSQGKLLVASEMKTFLPLGWQAEWDVHSLAEAGWNFDDRTVFKGVKKVRPGHYMTCTADGQIKQQQYWDMEYPDKRGHDHRTEAEMVRGVRERLLEAVRIRLRADVPVGVYLSGGIDSSVIAGMAVHLAKEGRAMGSMPAKDRVSCFTISFDKSSGFDESEIANRTADFLGVKVYKQVMDEEAFASRFEVATWHCEHHNPDLNFIGKFALSELPREHGFKVVLTGEGADEIFTGYDVFKPDFLREPDFTTPMRMPESERSRLFAKSEAEAMQHYASIGAGVTPKAQRKLNLNILASMAAFVPDVFDDRLAASHPRNPQDVLASSVPLLVLEKAQKVRHPVNTAQYIWAKHHLSNQFLSCLGDRTEMAHSIEGRMPFLDHHLTEYVNNLPPSVKMRYTGGDNFTAKWILREAMKPFLTPELYSCVKHPYSAPLAYEVGGPLYKLLNELISEENVKSLGFVSWDKVRDLTRGAFEGKEASAARLAFVVAQWVVLHRRFGVLTASMT